MSSLPRLEKKTSGWKCKLLSYGGKVILIKHVLQALPAYTLAAMNPPKGTFKLMERHLARFFWGTSNDKQRNHWYAWEIYVIPKRKEELE